MIRKFAVMSVCVLLVGCGDGKGSRYSSARALEAPATYIPVTPGAVPIASSQAATPAAVTTGSVTQVAAPAVLTEPVAITPGAVPIVTTPVNATPEPVITASAIAPATVLRPRLAPRSAAVVQTAAVALAPTPVPTPTAQQKPAPKPVQKAAVSRPTQRAAAAGSSKGPIYSACLNAGRKAATRKRCACVQSVANRELTAAQQKRGAGYFNNQQGLQDTRQSDNSANERFWKAWKAYGKSAAQVCRNT